MQEPAKYGPWNRQEGDTRIVQSIARTGPGCHNGCGVLLHMREGRLVKVEGKWEQAAWQDASDTIGGRDGGFMLAEGAVIYEGHLENIRAVVEAAKSCGVY